MIALIGESICCRECYTIEWRAFQGDLRFQDEIGRSSEPSLF
jgi:hypothetical protein